jgi:hypothetical protein
LVPKAPKVLWDPKVRVDSRATKVILVTLVRKVLRDRRESTVFRVRQVLVNRETRGPLGLRVIPVLPEPMAQKVPLGLRVLLVHKVLREPPVALVRKALKV